MFLSHFQKQFNKNYEGDEDKRRFNLFKDQVQGIIDHNEKYKKGEVTFSQGINNFTDLEQHERPGGGFKPKP